MNNLIEVKSDISNCDASFNSILSKFDKLDNILSNINDSLKNTKKWDGKIHDKCEDINKLIREYAKAIRPICVSFQDSISELTKSVDEFASVSSCVQKVKNW